MKLAFFLSFLGLAAAVPSDSGLRRRDSTGPNGGNNTGGESPKAEPKEVTKRLLVGAKNNILAVDFFSDSSEEGSRFEVKTTSALHEANPSWLLFQERDTVNTVYAVNEDAAELLVFQYDADTATLVDGRKFPSANGIVHLATDHQRTRMLASAYGDGVIEVWDISGKGDPKSVKVLNPNDTADASPTEPQRQPHPHQAVLHPTENIFAVNDLGNDAILVVDGQKDNDYKITKHFPVEPGCGPRHGVFHGPESNLVYTVVCENSNILLSYTVKVAGDGLDFKFRQLVSTFDPTQPPANVTSAAAGAIVVTPSSTHLYVSNRITGDDTDSISDFVIAGDGTLYFAGKVSSRRDNPRALALSTDERFLFVADMENSQGLHAFIRHDGGGLVERPLAHADLKKELGDAAETGPSFVMEVPIKSSE